MNEDMMDRFCWILVMCAGKKSDPLSRPGLLKPMGCTLHSSDPKCRVGSVGCVSFQDNLFVDLFSVMDLSNVFVVFFPMFLLFFSNVLFIP